MSETVGGAALGFAIQELLKLVLGTARKATRFKHSLDNLESILKEIDPKIQEIEQQNNELGRPQSELEELSRKIEEGKTLVRKCSKVGILNCRGKIKLRNQLEELHNWLTWYYKFVMPTLILRNTNDILKKVSEKQQSKFPKIITGGRLEELPPHLPQLLGSVRRRSHLV
ncbi:hypothetical protein Fmac_012039 [Flemingia macrophylla]|uniref:RPW8 domain-containing protein n=1 Tax=Flemingia macrophylla TaxID=520843 RepID=A0ABD1MPZ8_9FABA